MDQHPKYPSTWNLIGREWICWLLGHKWKWAWYRVRDPDTTDVDSLPYRETRGNPYWQHPASHHFKCSRCRNKVYEDYNSIHIRLIRGIRAVYRTLKFRFIDWDDDYLDKAKTNRLYYLLDGIASFANAGFQFMYDMFPHSRIAFLFCDLEFWCFDKMEKYVVYKEKSE